MDTNEQLYKKMYLILFNAITTAIDYMNVCADARAQITLVLAQQKTEQMFIDSIPDEPPAYAPWITE